MTHYKSCWTVRFLISILLVAFSAASIQAADFLLAWHYDCSDPNLIGFNVYYKEELSVVDNLDDCYMIYVPLSEEGFDPDNPTYEVTDLEDETTYFFAVAAVYEDAESALSNEVAGSDGEPDPTLDTGLSGSGGGHSSAACFIGTMAQ